VSITIKRGHIKAVTEKDDGSLDVDTGLCPFCHKPGWIKVPAKFVLDFAEWQNGAHIQKAMPWTDADDREQLNSGIHGACFDKEYPDE
jgi:hypothetical protein